MFCSQCGVQIGADAKFCFKCGAMAVSGSYGAVAVEGTTTIAGGIPDMVSMSSTEEVFQYVGFWQRVAASIIDGVLWIGFSIAVAFMPIDEELYTPMGFFLAWLYYALLESSTWQGTIGKKLMGISVCDLNGNRISFLRATGRYFSAFLSNLTLGIGYLMVAFTKRKQGLHDMVAGCIMLKK